MMFEENLENLLHFRKTLGELWANCEKNINKIFSNYKEN